MNGGIDARARDLRIEVRAMLAALLPRDAIAILFASDEMHRNGDQNFPFRQNSDLLYLTGIDQEKTVLLIFPGHPDPAMRELLFILESNPTIATWQGHKYSKEEATAISGIGNVRYIEEFDEALAGMLQLTDLVFLNSNEYPKYQNDNPDRQSRLNQELKSRYPQHRYERLAPPLTSLRAVKQDLEIEWMEKAAALTAGAYHRILGTLRPGMFEYEVEAEISYEFRRHGVKAHAYSPIVASGANALCLHYVENNSLCRDGDLLLLDFGCEWNGYASDLSRTLPMSGRFSPRQKQLYEAVLDVFERAKQLFVPGNSINKVNNTVWGWMEEKMIEAGLFTADDLKKQEAEQTLRTKYLPHGVSHFLGLDVHDVGDRDLTFEPGMVLTCEPGIYIAEEGMGIRIETDLLITESGPRDLFAGIPLSVEEIETAMANR